MDTLIPTPHLLKLTLPSHPTTSILLTKSQLTSTERLFLLEASHLHMALHTEVPPTEVPHTEVLHTEVPHTEVPHTEVRHMEALLMVVLATLTLSQLAVLAPLALVPALPMDLVLDLSDQPSEEIMVTTSLLTLQLPLALTTRLLGLLPLPMAALPLLAVMLLLAALLLMALVLMVDLSMLHLPTPLVLLTATILPTAPLLSLRHLTVVLLRSKLVAAVPLLVKLTSVALALPHLATMALPTMVSMEEPPSMTLFTLPKQLLTVPQVLLTMPLDMD